MDWVHGQPPRFWEGHLTGADNIVHWYNYRDAMPAPMQDSIIRCWTAWLMPERETELDPTLRRRYDNTSGKLVHPMVDDPRVGKSQDGKQAEWGQGDTYYKLTGDWRGNKSYYRSGFTREMSTANFNSSASSGALLNGQIIGAQHAMADGRAGLMQFPFWMWTHSAGVGQEYVDHWWTKSRCRGRCTWKRKAIPSSPTSARTTGCRALARSTSGFTCSDTGGAGRSCRRA